MEPTTARRTAAPAVNMEARAAGHMRAGSPRRSGGTNDDTGSRSLGLDEAATGVVPNAGQAAREREVRDDAPAPASTSQVAFGGMGGQPYAAQVNVPHASPVAATAAGEGAIAQAKIRASPAADEVSTSTRAGSGVCAVVGGCAISGKAAAAVGLQVAGVRGGAAAADSRPAPGAAQALSQPAAPLAGDRQPGTRRERDSAQVGPEGAALDGSEVAALPSLLPHIPPIVTPPFLPPNFMHDMCAVLWEHIIKAETARQAQRPEVTPWGGALPTARTDRPTGPEAPAVLLAVWHLQANKLPLGLLLQAAAHLAVAGIISTEDYQRLQDLGWDEEGHATGEVETWNGAGGPEACHTGTGLPVPAASAGGGSGSRPLTSSGVKRRLAAASSLAPAVVRADGVGGGSGGGVANRDGEAALPRTPSHVATATGGTSTADLGGVVYLSIGVDAPTQKRARLLVDDTSPSEAPPALEPALATVASTLCGKRPAAVATQNPTSARMAGGAAAAPGVTSGPAAWAAARTANAVAAPAAGDGDGYGAQLMVRQAGAGVPQRLGLGRRLFQVIKDQLPPGAELDCLLPPCNNLTGVLYSPNGPCEAVPGSDDAVAAGAALWDGRRLHDLGVYGSRHEARQSVYRSAAGAKPAARGRAGLLRQSSTTAADAATTAAAVAAEGEVPAQQQPQQRFGATAMASSARLVLPQPSPQRQQHLQQQLLQQPSSGRPPLPLPLAASGSVMTVMSGDQQGGFVLVPMSTERSDAQAVRIYHTLGAAGNAGLGLLVQASRPAPVEAPWDLFAPPPAHLQPPLLQHHPSATSVEATMSETGCSGGAVEPRNTLGTPRGDPMLPVLLSAFAPDAEVQLGGPTGRQRGDIAGGGSALIRTSLQVRGPASSEAGTGMRGNGVATRSEGSSRLAVDEAIVPQEGLPPETMQRLRKGTGAGAPGSGAAAHHGHSGTAPSSTALGLNNRASAAALAAGAAADRPACVTSLLLGQRSGLQQQQQQRRGQQLLGQPEQQRGEQSVKDTRGGGDYAFCMRDAVSAAALRGPTATPFATPSTSFFTLIEAAPLDGDPQQLLGEAPSVVSGQGPGSGPGPRSTSQAHKRQQRDPPPPPPRHEQQQQMQQQPLLQSQPARPRPEQARPPYTKAARAPTQPPQPQPQVSAVLNLVPSIRTAPAVLGGSFAGDDDVAVGPHPSSQQHLSRSKSFPTPAAPLGHLLAAVDVVEASWRPISSQSPPQLQPVHGPPSSCGAAGGASAAARPGSAGAAWSGPKSGRPLVRDGRGQGRGAQQAQRQGRDRGRGRGRPPRSGLGASPGSGPVVRSGEAP